jgi:hypothetical protein
MNSGFLTYQLPVFTGLMRHDESRTLLLRDEEVQGRLVSRTEIDAQVRSGDYFVMLATILDGLINDIDEFTTRIELENIVSDLIYLQDNYGISKKEPTG